MVKTSHQINNQPRHDVFITPEAIVDFARVVLAIHYICNKKK